MMSPFVTEAIGDSISLPVKVLLRTPYDHAGKRAFVVNSADVRPLLAAGFCNKIDPERTSGRRPSLGTVGPSRERVCG